MLGLPEDINNQLDRVLEYDERPINFRKEPWSYYKRNRWVVLTNKRVYLIKKVFFGVSYDIKQIVLSAAHFEMNEGILLDTIYIRVPSEGEHILNFFPTERESTIEFFDLMEENRDRQSQVKKEERELNKKRVAMAEMEALAKTFYENKISSQEYEKKKNDLMKKL